MIEKNEIIKNEEKIAESLNTFFANIVSNLKIPLHQDIDFAGGIDPEVGGDPIIQTNKKKIQKPCNYHSNKKILS